MVAIPLDGIVNEREVWAPLGEPVVGRPGRRLGILTGTAVFDFTGQGPQYLRDSLEFLVGPRFPDGSRIEQLVPPARWSASPTTARPSMPAGRSTRSTPPSTPPPIGSGWSPAWPSATATGTCSASATR
jgi:hypothetical protein